MTDCYYAWLGLVLLSLTLLMSLSINVVFCILRQRRSVCRAIDDCWSYQGESPSEDEGHYIYHHNHSELQENFLNHHDQQENPIYGNISTDRASVEVCYEMMTTSRTKDTGKPEVNYASLNLKVANKRRKTHRHQQGQTQDRNRSQDKLPAALSPPVATFLEVEAEVNASLPCRNSSPMVSHSSIYMNSQQIAQETEERERDRSVDTEMEHVAWEGTRWQERGSRKCKGEEKERMNGQNSGKEVTEAEAVGDGSDHFGSSFSHDNSQED
ncbi:hypothetical protein LDENG_00111080 [Lucifuga dentata]|nr:hypothetical protein LDENG_00111080 [Lucifuga dentata]